MNRVTRFAPSLTGYLHLGHVLHMIYVWSFARFVGGTVLSRMEDHDRMRSRPEYEGAILADMQWLGFVPDEGLMEGNAPVPSAYRQSDCSDFYEQQLAMLVERDLVYGCDCSRKDILAAQSETQKELCYTGTCAHKNLPLEGNTVRFRANANAVCFEDLLRGTCQQTPSDQCGDFSLRDRSGQWTYQFCCVCDDIRQGVNWVVRGEDIFYSTARQVQLMTVFSSPAPHYFHHKLLMNTAGNKLSKRQRSESVMQLREQGVTPEEVIGQAAFLGGLIPAYRPVTWAELDLSAIFERVS